MNEDMVQTVVNILQTAGGIAQEAFAGGVQRAVATGLIDIAIAVILAILATRLYAACQAERKKVMDADGYRHEEDGWSEYAVILMFFAIAVVIIFFVFLYVGVGKVVAPEWYTIQEILSRATP